MEEVGEVVNPWVSEEQLRTFPSPDDDNEATDEDVWEDIEDGEVVDDDEEEECEEQDVSPTRQLGRAVSTEDDGELSSELSLLGKSRSLLVDEQQESEEADDGLSTAVQATNSPFSSVAEINSAAKWWRKEILSSSKPSNILQSAFLRYLRWESLNRDI